MLLRVLDFETTGMPPEAAICEIGWCDVRTDAGEVAEVGDPRGILVNPLRPMPPEARAVHHISDHELASAVSIDAGLIELNHPSVDVFVAHNMAFEREFFTGGQKNWICTLKVGRRLWPQCPSHTNQCLRYFLGIELDDELAMPPHRAAPDAYVTAHILRSALGAGASIADMIEWSAGPSLLPRVNFGKHRGQAWKDLPGDYLAWIVNKSDMDAEVHGQALARPAAGGGAAMNLRLVKTPDQSDWELLKLANEKGKFGIALDYPFDQEERDAFERGIDQQWFTMVDLSRVSAAPGFIRIFRLTFAGVQRREELKALFGDAA